MSHFEDLPISSVVVNLSRRDLRAMLQLARLLNRLSWLTAYRELVFPQLPAQARFDPGHASLMMGYDFHLTEDGPKLIEVNTNAGGAFMAWQSERQADRVVPPAVPRFEARLLRSFQREWQDFSSAERPLQSIVVLDENPAEQGLFPEMQAYRDWLQEQGFSATIAAPEELQADREGVLVKQQRIDLIYNRHCDFFLETAELAGLREAYLNAQVCLSPNPFAYGLLADKRRMILWRDPAAMTTLGLTESERDRLLKMVPSSQLLTDCEPETCWTERKNLVFKPVDRFGGRGVIPGKSMTRKRFAAMEPSTTLVQELVPPSMVEDDQGREFKVDLRLFVYRNQLLGVVARLYRGQVTNLRTAGGGFASVRVD
jgi:hypothetical protein